MEIQKCIFIIVKNLYKENSIVSFIKKHVWIDPSDRDYVNSLNKNDFIEYVEKYTVNADDSFYDFKTKDEYRKWFLFDYSKSEKTYDILCELFDLANTTLTVKDLKDALCDVDVLEILQKRLGTDTPDIELAYTFLESFGDKQSASFVNTYLQRDQEFKSFEFENDLNAPEYQSE